MSEEAPPAPLSAVRTDVTGKRVVAAIIDMVILAILFVVMAMLFGDTESESGEGVSINLSGGPFLAYVALSFAYYFVFELTTGQTIGKKLMKLRVAMLDGSPITAGPSAIRNVLRVVDGLPFFYLVGFIAMMASKQKQRIGDMAGGTVVIEA